MKKIVWLIRGKFSLFFFSFPFARIMQEIGQEIEQTKKIKTRRCAGFIELAAEAANIFSRRFDLAQLLR